MTTPRPGRLERQQVASLPVGPIRTVEDERRYWHAVGIAARARIHRALIADGEEFCPICEEPLR